MPKITGADLKQISSRLNAEFNSYKSMLMVCTGTGCVAAKGFDVRDQLTQEIKNRGLEKDYLVVGTGCNGFCAVGPIIVVQPEGVFYEKIKADDIAEIVESHLQGGKIVERLLHKDLSSQVAIEKMNDFIATLKNKKSSKDEKQIALKFMIHLVGDLHQPLHVGRKNDKGGNDIKIKWFGEETNLHSIWDTKLIQHQNLSYTEYTDYLLLDIDYSDIRKWQGHSTMDYIRESKALRTQCYDFSGNSLKWEYFYKNKDLLELRLVQGGIRLSGELNRIFK